MGKHRRTDVSKVEHHLNIAISELINGAGGLKEWIGAITELKTLMKIKLKLEPVIEKASRVVSRKQRWRNKE